MRCVRSQGTGPPPPPPGPGTSHPAAAAAGLCPLGASVTPTSGASAALRGLGLAAAVRASFLRDRAGRERAYARARGVPALEDFGF